MNIDGEGLALQMVVAVVYCITLEARLMLFFFNGSVHECQHKRLEIFTM